MGASRPSAGGPKRRGSHDANARKGDGASRVRCGGGRDVRLVRRWQQLGLGRRSHDARSPRRRPPPPRRPRRPRPCCRRAARGCPRAPRARPACPTEAPTFLADVEDAIDTLRGEQPGIFEGNQVLNVGAYYVGLIKILDRKGLCADFDGEELGVTQHARLQRRVRRPDREERGAPLLRRDLLPRAGADLAGHARPPRPRAAASPRARRSPAAASPRADSTETSRAPSTSS